MKLTKRERKLGKVKKKKKPISPTLLANTEISDEEIKNKKIKNFFIAILIIGLLVGFYYLQTFNFNNHFSVSYIDVLLFFGLGIVWAVFYKYTNRFPFTKDDPDNQDDYFGAFSAVLVATVILHFCVVTPLQRIYTEKYGEPEMVYETIIIDKKITTQKTGKHSSRKVYWFELKSKKYDKESLEVSENLYNKLQLEDKVFIKKVHSEMGYFIRVDDYQYKTKYDDLIKPNNKARNENLAKSYNPYVDPCTTFLDILVHQPTSPSVISSQNPKILPFPNPCTDRR